MEDNKYNTPQSNLTTSPDDEKIDTIAVENRNAKYVLLALFVSPLITSVIFFIFSISTELIREAMGMGQVDIDLSSRLIIFLISFGFAFLMTLVVGMPLNWLLTKINRLQVQYFLYVGAIFPVFFAIPVGSTEVDFLTAFLMAITGAICLSSFWYIAAYLPSRGASKNGV